MTRAKESKAVEKASVTEVSPAAIRPHEIVRRAAVLGSGTMGAQIAAVFANAGIPCDLLDLASDPAQGRNRVAEAGKQRLLSLSPSPLYRKEVMDLIRPGNFDDDLGRLRDVDWVVEAVVERLDVKRSLWARVAPLLRENAVASSNTSGIPIRSIAEALPPSVRRRFLGTHFFNPPRYLRLLEVTPTADTDPDVAQRIARFAEHVLGKGIVIAHDVPNFVSNRIGCYGYMITLPAMEALGLGVDDVDAVTGPVIGRPNSATFRTLDVVGLDVFVDVCDNTIGFVTEEWEKAAYGVPPYVRDMLKRGWRGEKAGQGFYKRVRDGAATQILVLDSKTMEYRPRTKKSARSLAAVKGIDDLGERLRILVYADDWAGRFAWRLLSQVLVYSARKLGEIADDIVNIDRSLEWGFGWEAGPFAMWDELGVAKSVAGMEADGLAVPSWVKELAKRGGTFYKNEGTRSLQVMPDGKYAPVPTGEKTISLRNLRATGRRTFNRQGASILDLGDGVAFLDAHSPNQAIGYDLVEAIEEAGQRLGSDFRGLVISSHVTPNFCIGANIPLILNPALQGHWDEINQLIWRFQYGLLALKRAPFPTVVAPFGSTLGGGAEIVLAGARAVAAAETYLGLVEAGAGLVPAGGGCKELLARALARLPAEAKGDPKAMARAVASVFWTIGGGVVSGNAYHARDLGLLRAEDLVVPNLDHIVHEAKEAALALVARGYEAAAPARITVLGKDARASLEEGARRAVTSGQATEYDFVVARQLANILTGGDRPAGSLESEEYFLDLEREGLLALCHEQKSIDRMKHILETGRPLRN